MCCVYKKKMSAGRNRNSSKKKDLCLFFTREKEHQNMDTQTKSVTFEIQSNPY